MGAALNLTMSPVLRCFAGLALVGLALGANDASQAFTTWGPDGQVKQFQKPFAPSNLASTTWSSGVPSGPAPTSYGAQTDGMYWSDAFGSVSPVFLSSGSLSLSVSLCLALPGESSSLAARWSAPR